MEIKFDRTIKELFNEFYIGLVELSEVSSEPIKSIDELRKTIIDSIKNKYELENLKNIPTIRANRDFFWKIGIDPTKKRPSAEALIRRILNGKEIPQINLFVDLYNLMSIKYEISIAGFDWDKINGNILMRFAKNGEQFLGIGMKKPIILQGKEIILTDDSSILAIYPYRDSDHSKLTENTKKIILLTCGVPNYPKDRIIEATKELYSIFKEYLSANGIYKIFSSKNSN